MRKIFIVMAVILAAASGYAQSESMRPLFCRENRFPELHKLEIGGLVGYAQYDEYFLSQVDSKSYAEQGYHVFSNQKSKLKATTLTPYARYGLIENLTVYAKAPFSVMKSDVKNKTKTGINDVALGMELLAYEYTFKYPWVIPYVEVTLPTGDDKNHMGLGKADPIFGVAVGTTTFDKYTWILDGRYDANIFENGRFEGAACFIWDLDEKFSVLAEAKVAEKAPGSVKDVPIYFNGGMCYRPHEALSINAYAGTSANAEEDGHGGLKVAYSF